MSVLLFEVASDVRDRSLRTLAFPTIMHPNGHFKPVSCRDAGLVLMSKHRTV